MPMTYENIDPAAEQAKLASSTGYGDTSGVTDGDALAAEQAACVLELRHAFLTEHATSVLPNGADPDAVAMQRSADALVAAKDEARATSDRIAAINTTDVSGVMQPVLDANRHKAEHDFVTAEWNMANYPGLTQSQTDQLQNQCDRAEREASVIDNWGS